MQEYLNLSGKSGVAGYKIGVSSIIVGFKDNSQYEYTFPSAGTDNIERMKNLAIQGFGLNSFINKHVKYRYALKKQ